MIVQNLIGSRRPGWSLEWENKVARDVNLNDSFEQAPQSDTS